MRIELCEDNSLINDGVPTLIVVDITKDDGTNIRMPYEADKTIQQLYADVSKIPSLPTRKREMVFKENHKTQEDINLNDALTDVLGDQSKTIQSEDIVQCVHVVERDDGLEEDMTPILGHEYRVIEVLKKGPNVMAYHVLDDKADTKIRIPVFPNEIKLLRKKPPLRPEERRVMRPSVIKKCDCGEDAALLLSEDETKYEGECPNTACRRHLEEARKTQPAIKE